MKIATYNVNGVNGRLPVLLRWLQEEKPDIVCLQELKAPDEKFPAGPIRDLGYDAIWQGQRSWNGVAILSRVGEIHETRRGLPGDPDPSQSRYIEAAVNGVLIAGSNDCAWCGRMIYLPAQPCSISPVEGLLSMRTAPGQGARCQYELGTRTAATAA